MNATSVNLNPINAVQPSGAGKQQDAAVPDMPFSQVLSSEMKQNRNGSGTSKDAEVKAGSEAASQPAIPTDADAVATVKDTETEGSIGDPLLAESGLAMPDALLALVIHPDRVKPEPVGLDAAGSDLPAELSSNLQTTLEGRKGRAPQATQLLQAGQPGDEPADAQAIGSSLSGKAKPQAVATAAATAPATSGATAAATAFSGQLAAARQADAMKSGEFQSGPMSTPALQPTPAPHAQLDTLASLESVVANKLSPSVGTTAWSQALGEKIVWMAAGAQQTASLTLNPPNMGPLQIVLNVSNDQATASFFSAQPEVRHALESAFPKLREMMNEAGIQLGQATVSADTPRQNDTPDRQSQRVAAPFMGSDDASPVGLQSVHAPAMQTGRGLIDTFA